MITEEDSTNTYEFDWYYKILPTLNQWHFDKNRIKNGKKVDKGFIYSSANNSEWMTVEQLQNFINSTDYLELQKLNI